MLQREMPTYPEGFKTSLKEDFNFESRLFEIDCPIYLLYGSGDMNDEPLRVKNLNLSQKTRNKVAIKFIDDATHFPPFENPDATNRMIHALISEYESKD